MHGAGGELSIGRVEERAKEGHQKDEAAAPEALREGLGVPGKKGNRSHDRQIEKAALNAPIDGRSGAGIVVWLFQLQ
jgi:hypothetical protein